MWRLCVVLLAAWCVQSARAQCRSGGPLIPYGSGVCAYYLFYGTSLDENVEKEGRCLTFILSKFLGFQVDPVSCHSANSYEPGGIFRCRSVTTSPGADEQPRVVELNFPTGTPYTVNGVFPTEIAALQSLERINIVGGYLSG